ncbi:F0F1 ATP synthase subunit delta [Tersicoccus sp. Bi-70]|uniref:F0F1 ATP synthase subunit delta n=1 Tax=Tersicoccus sp. Bi-70 TaxID=1897634 RepID=UPI000975CD8E|nr:F0F1 ATP synthase subunit delta [Tersicoccus sp. Bi-70]OMH36640.1 F0F1 ATP synthase subunit delta [Tersicoccus sp. Bi-70]
MSGTSQTSAAEAQRDLEPRLERASGAMAGDLFAVVDLLDSSAGLRRALTDPSREAGQKSQLMRRLLAGKVGTDVEELAARAAGDRWSDPRDLVDALEELATTVVAADAENSDGKAGLDRLENDLFWFTQVVEGRHDVQRAFDEAQASSDAKSQLALRLVPGISPQAQQLIDRAVRAPRGLKPAALVERFLRRVAARQQRWIADVVVSRPLADDQFQRLQQGLNRLYGRDLKVTVRQDPELLGGLRVSVGDEVVDASVLSRLHELQRRLAG